MDSTPMGHRCRTARISHGHGRVTNGTGVMLRLGIKLDAAGASGLLRRPAFGPVSRPPLALHSRVSHLHSFEQRKRVPGA